MNQNTTFSPETGLIATHSRGETTGREQARQAGRLLAALWRGAAEMVTRAADNRRTRIERRKAREQFRAIDGHLLEDLGLTRSDLMAIPSYEKDGED